MLQYQPLTQDSCTMSKPNSTLWIPCIIYGDFKFLLIIYPLSHTHRVVHVLEASTTSDLIISYKSKLNLSSLVCICFRTFFLNYYMICIIGMIGENILANVTCYFMRFFCCHGGPKQTSTHQHTMKDEW